MSATDPRIEMLAEMREPAFRLGMAFAREAERAPDTATAIKFFNLFDRCAFSVRVGIALELRLERAPAVRLEARDPISDRENLVDREDLADRDPPERDDAYEPEYDRERDRETERASFPILIRALEGVCADAAKLPGPRPAELVTLTELLAKAKAAAAADPSRAGRLRTRRTGSGAGPALPPSRRPASNVGEVLARLRATGPP
jgi:hypothetical protein